MTNWTLDTKHSTNYSFLTKNVTSWESGLILLLQENSSYLLLEDTGKIILSSSWGLKHFGSWDYQTKH